MLIGKQPMYQSGGKRVFDIILALILAMPAALLCIACVLVIRAERTGPALFRQVRIGRQQREFVLYKLRTMSILTGNKASHEVDAAHITKVGRILRRTKLDELPQLINVFRGDMSFVGPRPCLPGQTDLINERQLRGVYKIRPGITGLAQLQGIDMSTPILLATTDAKYAANHSITLDLVYLIATAIGKGQGDAVNRHS
jgi:O-antigen biosynthesis protein WbqP